MKWKLATISALLIFSLNGCTAASGDYCAAYIPLPPLNSEVAEKLVSENRAAAVAIAANETYYRRNCTG